MIGIEVSKEETLALAQSCYHRVEDDLSTFSSGFSSDTFRPTIFTKNYERSSSQGML
jgi:hypothetical protein